VFAEWSSRIASERIKTAQAILRQQGRPIGGRRPYGYCVVVRDGQLPTTSRLLLRGHAENQHSGFLIV